MCNIKTRVVGKGIGFQEDDSYVSNFFLATFTMEKYLFSSSEQAYQFFKAKTCRQEQLASKILCQTRGILSWQATTSLRPQSGKPTKRHL